MGWQAYAPSFPSGSSWISVGSGGATTSNYKAEIQVHVARMTTNQVCIRFKLTSGDGTSGNFYYPGYVNFSVGNLRERLRVPLPPRQEHHAHARRKDA